MQPGCGMSLGFSGWLTTAYTANVLVYISCQDSICSLTPKCCWSATEHCCGAVYHQLRTVSNVDKYAFLLLVNTEQTRCLEIAVAGTQMTASTAVALSKLYTLVCCMFFGFSDCRNSTSLVCLQNSLTKRRVCRAPSPLLLCA